MIVSCWQLDSKSEYIAWITLQACGGFCFLQLGRHLVQKMCPVFGTHEISKAFCRCLSMEIHRKTNSKEHLLLVNLPHISFL